MWQSIAYLCFSMGWSSKARIFGVIGSFLILPKFCQILGEIFQFSDSREIRYIRVFRSAEHDFEIWFAISVTERLQKYFLCRKNVYFRIHTFHPLQYDFAIQSWPKLKKCAQHFWSPWNFSYLKGILYFRDTTSLQANILALATPKNWFSSICGFQTICRKKVIEEHL